MTAQTLATHKIVIGARISADRSALEIRLATEDRRPLTPQHVLDVIADYLLIDPKGLFSEEVT